MLYCCFHPHWGILKLSGSVFLWLPIGITCHFNKPFGCSVSVICVRRVPLYSFMHARFCTTQQSLTVTLLYSWLSSLQSTFIPPPITSAILQQPHKVILYQASGSSLRQRQRFWGHPCAHCSKNSSYLHALYGATAHIRTFCYGSRDPLPRPIPLNLSWTPTLARISSGPQIYPCSWFSTYT